MPFGAATTPTFLCAAICVPGERGRRQFPLESRRRLAGASVTIAYAGPSGGRRGDRADGTSNLEPRSSEPTQAAAQSTHRAIGEDGDRRLRGSAVASGSVHPSQRRSCGGLGCRAERCDGTDRRRSGAVRRSDHPHPWFDERRGDRRERLGHDMGRSTRAVTVRRRVPRPRLRSPSTPQMPRLRPGNHTPSSSGLPPIRRRLSNRPALSWLTAVSGEAVVRVSRDVAPASPGSTGEASRHGAAARLRWPPRSSGGSSRSTSRRSPRGAYGRWHYYLDGSRTAPLAYDCEAAQDGSRLVFDVSKVERAGDYTGALTVGETDVAINLRQTTRLGWGDRHPVARVPHRVGHGIPGRRIE